MQRRRSHETARSTDGGIPTALHHFDLQKCSEQSIYSRGFSKSDTFVLLDRHLRDIHRDTSEAVILFYS
uniref:Uncharacterized protein n=1 Tax=Steinernema glaseri TaxID=37863 RepID=A0A1I7Y3E8_9BILA